MRTLILSMKVAASLAAIPMSCYLGHAIVVWLLINR
jgi:hypothetical protein